MTNVAGNSVTEFARGATGNASPIATIKGTSTGLLMPEAVSVDAAGQLFVTHSGAGTVTE